MNSVSLGGCILLAALIHEAFHEEEERDFELPPEEVIAIFSRAIAIGTVGATLGAKATGGSLGGAYLGGAATLFGSVVFLPLEELPEPELMTQQALITIRAALDFF